MQMTEKAMEKKTELKLPCPAAWTMGALAGIPFCVMVLTRLIMVQDIAVVKQWFLSHGEAAALEGTALVFLCAYVYGLTGKLWAAAVSAGLPMLLLTLVSYYKMVINGTPLLLRDFALAGQFWSVAGYAMPQITLSEEISGILTGFVLLVVLAWGTDRFLAPQRRLRRTLVAAAAVGVALAASPLYTAWAVSLEPEKLSQEERVAEYGPVLSLFCSYARVAEAPPMSQMGDLERLQFQLEMLPLEKEDPDAKKPTVIFLMSESFFDVTKLPAVSFSKDPVPVFRALSEEYTSGDFLSNTYCGGTGWVEMEVLTGICSNFLNESDTLTSLAGESTYTNMPSVPRIFQNAGYRTTFLHAYTSELYERSVIYPQLGFDEVLFMDDFPADAEKRGGYLSDSALAKEIISRYEAGGEEPMMLFAVSMENHQPYRAEKFGGEAEVKVESDALAEEELAVLQSYVTGLHDADRALGELVDYFEKQEEPVMIVFFGDHLPSLGLSEKETVYSKLGYSSTAVTTDWEPEELAKMLSTDYLIWTNYEGAAEADHAESCTLLGLSVLERIGLQPDPYFAWLREYAEPEMLLYRPRLYVNASGEAFSAIPEGQAAVMQDYQNAVRDIAYGGNVVFGAERAEGMNETSPAA